MPSLRDIPGEIDLAYVLVDTRHVEAAIADCAARGVKVACVLADGFAETGPDGVALQRRIVETARDGGVRLLGPNSMGVINLPAHTACSVNAVLEADALPAGRWSLVSHSGSMMGTIASRAAGRGCGFAKIVGTGNEADLTAGEIADLLVDDPDTDAILLFLETIRRPELFEQAARRAHAAGKPIVAYKLGRSEAAARLATTHTGALAGSDAAADAFFRAVGIVRVDQIETLLELPPLLLGRKPPVAPQRAVRIVTTTGGGGAMVVDRLGLADIATAHMLDTTLAGASKAFVADALNAARDAEDADVAIAVIGSSAQFRPQEGVAGVIAATGKHPICAFLVPQADAALRLLNDAGIAAFRTPEACADAVRAYLDWRAPRPKVDAGDVSGAGKLLALADDEPGARAVFAALGVADGAVRIDPDAPPSLAYPVALKAVSAAIAHKTEAGAVALNVADATALRAAATAMRARLGDRITGFIAQPDGERRGRGDPRLPPRSVGRPHRGARRRRRAGRGVSRRRAAPRAGERGRGHGDDRRGQGPRPRARLSRHAERRPGRAGPRGGGGLPPRRAAQRDRGRDQPADRAARRPGRGDGRRAAGVRDRDHDRHGRPGAGHLRFNRSAWMAGSSPAMTDGT